jgi:gentisate 1,2-dioxygenase
MTQIEVASLPVTSPLSKLSRDDLLSDLESLNTKPLWAQMTKLNPPLPNPSAVPHVWRYDKIRPSLLRAGKLITEKEAERRVLMLINPALGMLESAVLYCEASFTIQIPMRDSLQTLPTQPTQFTPAFNS